MKRLAEAVLAHRLVLSADAELSDVSARDVVADILETVEPPESSDREVAPVSNGSPEDTKPD